MRWAMDPDPPTWKHTTQTGPVIVRWLIEPGESNPTTKDFGWKVTLELVAPPGWTLATASSGTAPIERLSEEPLLLAFPFKEGFPPLGPGPFLDTQWQSPAGPVSLRFDPELTWRTLVEIPGQDDTPPPTPWDWPVLGLVAAWIILGVALSGLLWIRWKRATDRWARRWWRSQPRPDAPWLDWEKWLADLEKDHREKDHRGHPLLTTPQKWQDWRALGELIPQARFGRPENRAWRELLEKMKTMGNLDNLVNSGRVSGR